jgi:hypothetical protein
MCSGLLPGGVYVFRSVACRVVDRGNHAHVSVFRRVRRLTGVGRCKHEVFMECKYASWRKHESVGVSS